MCCSKHGHMTHIGHHQEATDQAGTEDLGLQPRQGQATQKSLGLDGHNRGEARHPGDPGPSSGLSGKFCGWLWRQGQRNL